MVTESRRLAVLLYLLFFAAFPSDVTAASAFERQLQSRVTALPGQSFSVSFAHYSGYVTVNKEAGRALFYWFFEATEDPASKPLVLWLNGGPGCSSIAYGLAEELGPFHVKADGKSLYLNPYSWNQVANILFLDSPVGVGFSYANNSQDVVTNGDKRTAQDSLAFLKNWFKLFPQYRGREFYLTGESYAGHYVPQLAQAIVRSQKLTGEKSINLKGYMVGNALTDDYHDHYGVFHFMWTAGLISDQTYKLLNIFCDFQSFVHTSSACERILDIADKEIGNIDPYSIFTPSCTANVTLSRNKLLKRRHSFGIIGEKYDPCTEKHSTVYFNLPEVQKALHVNPAYAPKKWETCSDVVNENWKDSESSVLHIYHELISQGLRIWIFSGDTDAVIPVASTRYNVNALKLPTVTPWHAWYDDGQETEEKKRRLVETRQKKRRLLSEVRFFRRKYETLSANQCHQFRLKEPSHTEPVIIAQPGNKLVLSGKPPTGKKPKVSEAARTSNYNLNSLNTHTSQRQFTKTSRKRPTESLCFAQSSSTHDRVMEAANDSTSATLGVNEVAFKNGQEMNQFKLEQNHKQMQRFNRVPIMGGGSKDKLAICRDLGNNSKKIGKRKLSWRDPLVLEV